MKRFLYLFYCILLSFPLLAQIDQTNDSIPVAGLDNQPSMQGSQKGKSENLSKGEIKYNSSLSTDENAIQLNLPPLFYYAGPPLAKEFESRLPFANDYAYSGAIAIDQNSYISGGSIQRTYLGSGRRQVSSINYHRQIDDKWSASAGLTIDKNSLDRVGANTSLFSEAVFSGAVDYKINERMNLSLSGDYSMYRTGASRGISPGSLMGNYFPEEPGQFSYGFRPVYWTELQFGYQVTDWLYIAPGAYSSRYEFYGNHFNDYGFNTMVGIRVHERIKFNLYGKKSLRGTDYSFGPKGLHPQDMYGGGIEFKVNETFSIEAGVTREINPFTGKWETKPYVNPVIHIK